MFGAKAFDQASIALMSFGRIGKAIEISCCLILSSAIQSGAEHVTSRRT